MREKPIKQAIIEGVILALKKIRTPEFRTDIGANVFLGRSKLGPSELPCIVVWPQVETATKEVYGAYTRRLELKIEAVAESGIEVEAMAGDIFEAMGEAVIPQPKSVVYTGGGVTDYPEIGESIVGVSLTYEVVFRTDLKRAYI